MNNPLRYSVSIENWNAARTAALSVRYPVFVEEQGVPADIEEDEWDPRCEHALVRVDGRCVGTGRLLPDGHIGRMAVLKPWRGQGIGDALMRALVGRAIERGMKHLALNAQTHAIPFYARHGFEADGEEFEEAGIPHRWMRRVL